MIDDDASVRAAINSLLMSVGLDTKLFASAQEFLASKLPDAPTCIISDIRLPGLSGLDLQKELARTHVDLPIIILTGHGDIPMAVQAMKAGAIEFLTKPFRDQDLLDAVHAGLDRHRSRRKDGAAVADIRKRFDGLTSREKEVMKLVVTGLLNKQIAARIGVSEVT
ncbi:MAG: response regulator transcription factor, partial [Rhodospirillaceae bacterium]|nr:response regulator transcription factor [Rhodospirillaceae bacterium]